MSDWQRLYEGLCAMRPDGSFDDKEVAIDLVLAGLIESREVKKPCRTCGTPLFDYRYTHVTAAGRMFMNAAASALEARRGETGTGSIGEADDIATAESRDAQQGQPQ